MRHGLTTRAIRWLVPLCGLTIAAVARGQLSSTNFRAVVSTGSSAGVSTSTNFRLLGEAGRQPLGRMSGNVTDAVAGLVGSLFSPQATITLATTGGTYSLVSIPVTPSAPAASSVFASLGSPDITAWRFGHWSPADSAYTEVGGTLPLTTIAQAQGYWLITAANQSVSVTGLPAKSNPGGYVIVTLGAGPAGRPAWNQIGNPYLYPIRLSDILVYDGVFRSLTDPANLATTQSVKVRSGSSYTDVTNFINGRQAFWIKKLESGTVQLYFPPLPSTIGGTPVPALEKPAGSNWAVSIGTTMNGRQSEPMWLGAAAVSPTGWNPLSVARGPDPPGGADLSLSVPKRDWGVLNDSYVRLFQPASDRMSWDLVLSGSDGPGEAALRFDSADLPAGLRLWLTDPAIGWTREVVSGHSISVAVGAGPKSLRFEVTSGGAALASTPISTELRAAYPNPFRESAGLSFSLARGGDVSVDIFDLQGRRVRMIERRGLAAGEHVLVWDGKDDGGNVAGNGVYLARWHAAGETGTGRLVKVD
jgi:hypothetical protein